MRRERARHPGPATILWRRNHENEVGERVDVESFAGRDEAGEDGSGSPSVIAPEEQAVLRPEGDSLPASLGTVVVDLQVSVFPVVDRRPSVSTYLSAAILRRTRERRLCRPTVPKVRKTLLCSTTLSERPETRFTLRTRYDRQDIGVYGDIKADAVELRVLELGKES